MITLLIVALALVAYLAVGLVLAKVRTPRLVARHTYKIVDYRYRLIKADPIYSVDPDGDVDRQRVLGGQVLTLTLWPVMFPAALIRDTFDASADRCDPAIGRKQQERIRELERELGMVSR